MRYNIYFYSSGGYKPPPAHLCTAQPERRRLFQNDGYEQCPFIFKKEEAVAKNLLYVYCMEKLKDLPPVMTLSITRLVGP